MSKAAREPFLRRWGRRVLTIPAFFLVGTVYLALLPLTLAFTAALDLLRPGAGTFSRSRAVLVFALYVVCELVGIAVALAIGDGRNACTASGRNPFCLSHTARFSMSSSSVPGCAAMK